MGAQHEQKQSNRKIVGNDGPPCGRCKQPTQIRDLIAVTPKIQRRPFYYRRYYCTDRSCKTTLIMPKEFRVFRNEKLREVFEQRERQTETNSDVALDFLDGTQGPLPSPSNDQTLAMSNPELFSVYRAWRQRDVEPPANVLREIDRRAKAGP